MHNELNSAKTLYQEVVIRLIHFELLFFFSNWLLVKILEGKFFEAIVFLCIIFYVSLKEKKGNMEMVNDLKKDFHITHKNRESMKL